MVNITKRSMSSLQQIIYARIRAVLRRRSPEDAGVALKAGPVELDPLSAVREIMEKVFKLGDATDGTHTG